MNHFAIKTRGRLNVFTKKSLILRLGCIVNGFWVFNEWNDKNPTDEPVDTQIKQQ